METDDLERDLYIEEKKIEKMAKGATTKRLLYLLIKL